MKEDCRDCPEEAEKSRKDWGNPSFDGSWILWALLLFLGGVMLFALLRGGETDALTLSYSDFREQVLSDNVDSVQVTGERVTGKLVSPIKRTNEAGETLTRNEFITYLPPLSNDSLLALMEQHGVEVRVQPVNDFPWWRVALSLLPLLAIVGLGVFFFRRLSSQGLGGTRSITRSRAKMYERSAARTTFQDVAGASAAKRELEEVIEFLKSPERFRRLGAQIPKGVLLVGPPGTGKTLLARAVAGEADAAFFSLSGSDFTEVFVGVGASRVRDLFEQAKKSSPAIIFIDELDSVGRRRGLGFGGGGDEEREQTLNQLLSEMDGFEPSESVIVMAATNRPDVLDPALQRPGRFDRQVMVDTPTASERVEILRVHARNKPLAADVDLERVARATPGFSGADLANLLNEAALLAARVDKEAIESADIAEARDKVLMGLERDIVMTPEEARLVAYHEAGHAIVAVLLPNADPLDKVTIIPRGRAMGVTQQLPERDRFLYPREYLLDRIAVMMGGRAAEKLVMDDITSGAEDDLRQATRLARKMVMDWGMSDRFSTIRLSSENGAGYLGDSFSAREYSEQTVQAIDSEVQGILDAAYQRAESLLRENRAGMDRVVETLVEREQIDAETLKALLFAESGSQSGHLGAV